MCVIVYLRVLNLHSVRLRVVHLCMVHMYDIDLRVLVEVAVYILNVAGCVVGCKYSLSAS